MEKTFITDCHYCVGEKHHIRLFVKKGKVLIEDEENKNGSEFITYMVLECCGCKMVSFVSKVRNHVSGARQPKHIVKQFYHHMDEGVDRFNFLRDKDHAKLPPKIRDLYDEVTFAFMNGMKISAATLLRTLVETVCNDQKIVGNTLYKKIEALHSNGLISTSELPILDKLRQIGNHSTHEAKIFSLNTLSYAVDVVNHLLVSVYVLPKINRLLKVT